MSKKPEILKILAQNARYTNAELAAMTGKTEEEVAKEIKRLEKEKLIRGYKAVVDWDKFDDAYVSAIVELKVVPKPDLGFEDIAARISAYTNVETVYLMSGTFDLSVVVKGRTLQEVANFVAKELAAMESVTSTATHFVMRRYKELDVVLIGDEDDDRYESLI